MNLIINKYKLLSVITIFILFFVMHYLYVNFVFNYFEYTNFKKEFNLYRLIFIYLAFIIIIFFLLFSKSSSFLFFINSIFTLILVIPNFIMFIYTDDFDFTIIAGIIFFIFIMILFAQIKIKQIIKINHLSDKQNLFLIIILIFLMLIPFILTFKFNITLKAFNIENTYEIRENTGSQMSSLMSYLNSWLSKILLPIAIILGIKSKNWFIVTITSLTLLYIFLILAHKTVLFSIIVVLFFSIFKNGYKQIFVFLSVFLIIVLISDVLTAISGNILLESLIVRRVLFVPALLNNLYFDFFAGRPVYLSYSFLSFFSNYPYDVDPSHLIGISYFNSEALSANNGFISDGFMNFGKIGVFVFAFFVAMVFKFFDTLKISRRFSGLFFIIIFTLISSSFFTSLISHGILLLMLVSMFILRNSENENE